MALGRLAWVIAGLVVVAGGAAGGYFLFAKDGGLDSITEIFAKEDGETGTEFKKGEIARLGKASIDADDLRVQLGLLAPEDRAAVTQNPELLSNVIRTLLVHRTVLDEALAEDWDDRADVKAQIARAREVAIVENYLQAKTAPPDSYPSEDELQEAYEANKNAFRLPQQYRLAQIHISLPKSAGQDDAATAQARLRAVQAKLSAGEDFAKIASEQPETAANDGDIGWLFESQMRPEIRNALKSLKKGGLSDPIRLDDGWHIIRITDTRPSTIRPFEDVRDDLARKLRSDRAMALRQEHISGLIGDADIAINEAGLTELISEP